MFGMGWFHWFIIAIILHPLFVFVLLHVLARLLVSLPYMCLVLRKVWYSIFSIVTRLVLMILKYGVTLSKRSKRFNWAFIYHFYPLRACKAIYNYWRYFRLHVLNRFSIAILRARNVNILYHDPVMFIFGQLCELLRAIATYLAALFWLQVIVFLAGAILNWTNVIQMPMDDLLWHLLYSFIGTFKCLFSLYECPDDLIGLKMILRGSHGLAADGHVARVLLIYLFFQWYGILYNRYAVEEKTSTLTEDQRDNFIKLVALIIGRFFRFRRFVFRDVNSLFEGYKYVVKFNKLPNCKEPHIDDFIDRTSYKLFYRKPAKGDYAFPILILPTTTRSVRINSLVLIFSLATLIIFMLGCMKVFFMSDSEAAGMGSAAFYSSYSRTHYHDNLLSTATTTGTVWGMLQYYTSLVLTVLFKHFVRLFLLTPLLLAHYIAHLYFATPDALLKLLILYLVLILLPITLCYLLEFYSRDIKWLRRYLIKLWYIFSKYLANLLRATKLPIPRGYINAIERGYLLTLVITSLLTLAFLHTLFDIHYFIITRFASELDYIYPFTYRCIFTEVYKPIHSVFCRLSALYIEFGLHQSIFNIIFIVLILLKSVASTFAIWRYDMYWLLVTVTAHLFRYIKLFK